MLRIQYADYEALRAHGEETYPNECCGVLLGKNIAGEGNHVQQRSARLDFDEKIDITVWPRLTTNR